MNELRKVRDAIKSLDEIPPKGLGDEENETRRHIARKSLINILFDKGYELQEYTYRIVKSQRKRELLK